MPEICCSTFQSHSYGWRDLSVGPDLVVDKIAAAHLPIIWQPQLGLYSFNGTAIGFCPWCGSPLPNKFEEAMAMARDRTQVIHIGPAVQVDIQGPSGEAMRDLLASLGLPSSPD
jgi:hypothetical protein